MPLSDKLDTEYQQALKDIGDKFQTVDPQAVQKALSQGGSFSGSLGFNSPFDVMGLTPNQFDTVLENRSRILNDNLKAVAGAMDLRDKLYGISENRRAAQEAARDIYSQGKAGERQQAALDQNQQQFEMSYEQSDRQFQSRLAQEEALFDKRLGFENTWKEKEYRLDKERLGLERQKIASDEQWRSKELGIRLAEHKANMSYNYAQLQEMKRQHNLAAQQQAESNKIAWAGVGLKKQEIEALSMQRVATYELMQQQFVQKELENTNKYIASLLKTKAMKKGDNFETDTALFYATIKRNAMSGVSGLESKIPMPEKKVILGRNKKLFEGYDSVIIAPTDGKGWKKGDVLGVKGDQVDSKPLMPNPARNETSMQILMNKMPGYTMAPAKFDSEEE